MVQMEKLDIRTITMGISLHDCAHPELAVAATRAYDKICRRAARNTTARGDVPLQKRILRGPAPVQLPCVSCCAFTKTAGGRKN
ncbi:MAG: DUF711 family protein [Steroidobacteraceae bacterium]